MPSNYSIAKDALLRFLAQSAAYDTQFFYRTGLPENFMQFLQREGISLDRQRDELLVQQAFWDLVGNGLAMPGSRVGQGADLPHICVTDYGIQCVNEGRRLPIDSEGFIEEMNLDDVDDIIKLYIEEAVSSFSARNYLAAVVMAGGAMEKAILVLTEGYEAKVNVTDKAEYQTKVLAKEKIKTRFDQFLKFLEDKGIKSSLSRSDQETLDSLFPAIVNLIRITRNDVGHPTGKTVERDEAEAHIYLLKTALRFIYSFLA